MGPRLLGIRASAGLHKLQSVGLTLVFTQTGLRVCRVSKYNPRVGGGGGVTLFTPLSQ